MITVTLMYADGREQTIEIDPGTCAYPLTIRAARLPTLQSILSDPDSLLHREMEQAKAMDDPVGYLQYMASLSDEEREGLDRQRWYTFDLVDPETLRYQERVSWNLCA